MLIGIGFALTLPRRLASAGTPTTPPQLLLLAEDGSALATEDGGTLTLEEPS